MKTALITGASRGIGRAVARELAHQGWAVGINYLNRADKARELVEELTAEGCHAAMFQADVADSAAVAEMVRKLGETFSPVELVVNNAGVSGQGLFQDTTDEMWDRYLAVNLSGARNTVKAALPPHDLGKTGLHRKYFLHLGPAGGKLRGGLLLHKGRHHRPDPVVGYGIGPLRHPGKLRGPRRHQH